MSKSHLKIAQEVRGSIVHIHGLKQVGVPVGQVREHPGVIVEVTKAAIGTTRDAHSVPEPCSSQELVDDIGGPM